MTRHDTDGETDDGLDRKRLIRVVVVLAFAVPVVVEGATFAGLVDQQLLGGGADGPATSTATETTTPAVDRVGTGDAVLAETPQREVVTDATIVARDGEWTYRLALRVNNTADTDYRLTFGEATTTSGTAVVGNGSVVVPAGESRTVTGTWSLPEGERPDTVTLVGVQLDGDGTVRETVPVERVAVAFE